MSGSADKRRQHWLYARWEKDPTCDYCDAVTRLCLPDEETGCAPDDMATTDHYVPLAKNGSDRQSNWRLACCKCNQDKADQWPEVWLGLVDEDWREEPAKTPTALALALQGIVATA